MSWEQKPLISVIVPVYKVEKYLNRCIDSIVNQTYSDLEIILVEDGSPDNCQKICDDWCDKDNRIRTIHKTNEGLSSARNTGLEQAKGEYICFVDSDDWIEKEMVETLYNACKENKTLLSVCGRYIVSNGEKIKDKCFPKSSVINSVEFLKYMFVGKDCDCAVWDKLYHKSLWDNIYFPNGRIYEDIAVQYKIVLKNDSIAIINKPLYNYFRREGSITRERFSERLFDYPFNTRNLLKDIANIQPELYEYASWMHTKALHKALKEMSLADRVAYKKYKERLKILSKELSEYKNIWTSSEVFSNKDKLLCEIFSRWYILRPFCRVKRVLKELIK